MNIKELEQLEEDLKVLGQLEINKARRLISHTLNTLINEVIKLKKLNENL